MARKFTLSRRGLVICVLISLLLWVKFNRSGSTKFITNTKQPLKGIELFLDPETSTRNNFGTLLERILQDAHKEKGNFLEIGGGSGAFFDHNMARFGHMVENYVIIEPYSLFSDTKERLPAFAEKVEKWKSGKVIRLRLRT